MSTKSAQRQYHVLGFTGDNMVSVSLFCDTLQQILILSTGFLYKLSFLLRFYSLLPLSYRQIKDETQWLAYYSSNTFNNSRSDKVLACRPSKESIFSICNFFFSCIQRVR